MGSKIFRALSLFVGICGVVVYAIWLLTWWIEWRQGGYAAKAFLEQLWFMLDGAIFLSGLPPLLLTVYFLILKKSAKANLRGLIYVFLFIPYHYYVASLTAHSTPENYLPAQLLELIIAVALIVLWNYKESRSR